MPTPVDIARAMASGDKDIVVSPNNRVAHWHERVDMAQWWADYLDVLRKGAEVVPMRAAG
ncbi:hypothetical protein [Sandarakinorhabdus rubra]|uniref:hypothetical protein n=1 Tax=Sandarakinorhabdus rubra TaxID=2672568 RepID=UPI001969E977|nr:hypothetical protein [Sandarakinorhabdus rubra]